MLGTKWAASNNFQTWRRKLREGITFHDGSPFTADDVVFTWEVLTAKESVAVQASFLRSLMGSVGTLEIVNDHEVVINLARPEVNLLYFLSTDMETKLVSRKYWAKVGGEKDYVTNPVGAGPYRFVKFQPGIGTSYTRVENH